MNDQNKAIKCSRLCKCKHQVFAPFFLSLARSAFHSRGNVCAHINHMCRAKQTETISLVLYFDPFGLWPTFGAHSKCFKAHSRARFFENLILGGKTPKYRMKICFSEKRYFFYSQALCMPRYFL